MPIDPISLIGAGGSVASGIMALLNQGQSNTNQANQLQLALANYNLQKQQGERQYELATAGRQDARGNKTKYVPGVGWVEDVTPETRDIVKGSDAVQRQS